MCSRAAVPPSSVLGRPCCSPGRAVVQLRQAESGQHLFLWQMFSSSSCPAAFSCHRGTNPRGSEQSTLTRNEENKEEAGLTLGFGAVLLQLQVPRVKPPWALV